MNVTGGSVDIHTFTVALEVTPLTRPGADRGLGRYVTAVQEALEQIGHCVRPVEMARRDGRSAEFVDLLCRRRALRRLEFDVFHATSAYTVAGPLNGRTVTSILDLIPIEVASRLVQAQCLLSRSTAQIESRSAFVFPIAGSSSRHYPPGLSSG